MNAAKDRRCQPSRDALGRFTTKQARWTRDEAVAAVRAFHERHGYQPISREARVFNQLPSFGVAVKLFGSWNAMIEAAGFRPYPALSSAKAKMMAWRDRNPKEARRVAA